MTDTLNKERTSISIDPELLAECKNYCKSLSVLSDKKLTFSRLVTQALKSYVKEGETPLLATLASKPFNGYQAYV